MPSSKTALETLIDNDITTNGTGDITGAKVNNVLKDIVESYQDVIRQLTTAQINALTPTLNQIVFNTDTNYLMQYNGSLWVSLVAVLIGNTAAINASTPKEGQLFYNTTTKTLSFGDGVTHVGVQTDECTCVKTVKVTLSSAQILNSFTTPVELIPAPGAGKVIDFKSALIVLNYGTTPYATNINSVIWIFDDTTPLINTFTIGASANTIHKRSAVDYTAALSSFENQAIFYQTEDGNPTAGDSTLDIYITYSIMTL